MLHGREPLHSSVLICGNLREAGTWALGDIRFGRGHEMANE
jgi:hypothetical protein